MSFFYPAIIFAARSKYDDNTQLIIAITLCAVGLIASILKAIADSAAKKAEEKQAKENKRKYRYWMANIRSQGGFFPVISANIPLSSGERCFFYSKATLKEPRSVRKSHHTGGAIRVARGVSIGRGYTTSEAHEEWREIAKGVFYITNQRVMFEGDMQSRNIKMENVLSCQNGGTSIAIASTTRQRTMVFHGFNGYIASTIINSIKNSQR